MESPDEWRRELEAVLAAADDALQSDPPDQPESPHLILDELLFGAVSTNWAPGPEVVREGSAPPALIDALVQGIVVDEDELAREDVFLDEDRFVAEDEFGEPDVFVEPDELVDEDESADDDTIVAEPAYLEDAPEPSGRERGRRRAWVLAGLVTLILATGAVAGTVVVGGAADSAPRKKGDSDRKEPITTTTPAVPTTALASTAPPAPPPPAPTTSPPATTSSPTTSPPTTTSAP